MGGTAGTADTEAGGNKNMINVPIKIEIKDNNLHSNSSNSMKTDSFLSQNIKDEKEKEVRRTLETFLIKCCYTESSFSSKSVPGRAPAGGFPSPFTPQTKAKTTFHTPAFRGEYFHQLMEKC